MSLTVGDLFATPDHYLFAFEGDQAALMPMDRAAYARSIFLDRRISPASDGVLGVPTSMLLTYARRLEPAPPRIGWIFHVAHCGSTLLARALERGADNLVLREPVALRQLGAEGARGGAGDWRERLALALRFTAKRYRADAAVIVKANVPVNFILPPLLADQPDAPIIFLYYPLEDYLLAILRSDGHRQWVRSITAELRPAIEAAAGSLDGLDVAELAAMLWLAQIYIYQGALTRYPNARSLSAEQLFGDPAPVLAAAFALFGMKVAAPEIDAIVAGPLFTTYSKDPSVRFDNQAREDRKAALLRELGPELAAARALVARRAATHPVPDRLAQPLTGESPPLL